MSAIAAFPSGDQWKDVTFVTNWKAGRRKVFDDKWRERFPDLLTGTALSATRIPPASIGGAPTAHFSDTIDVQWENETLIHRAHRLETDPRARKSKPSGKSHYTVPALIAQDAAGWILQPITRRARPGKIEKAKAMYENDLEKKAQRELACGLIGGEVVCRTGHAFRVNYECGNRYCVTCGPRQANRLFARQMPRLLFASTRLLMCGQTHGVHNLECEECSQAIEKGELPHWPPAHGTKPKIVVAKLDFTILNTGKMPTPDLMRTLNGYIKKFCRAIEKRFGITRKEYGLAYCDELGGGNTNAHAHGLYVGPWLPQRKGVCELSQLWAEVTGYNGPKPCSMSGGKAGREAVRRGADQFTDGSQGGFIISIKYARSFTAALYHAVKYPAKFATRSTPTRLAELEIVFHRVRRFHTLAAFYAPEVPTPEKPETKKCPLCAARLSDVGPWQTLEDLERRGLRDFSEVERELARERAFAGPSPPP